MQAAFWDAFYRGDFAEVKRLHVVGSMKKQKPCHRAFCHACANGRLDMAQWLFRLQRAAGIRLAVEGAFACACQNGHLAVGKWLLELQDIHPWHKRVQALQACANGHLEVAKWLLGLHDVDLSANDWQDALRQACGGGHMHVARWLYGLGVVETHAGLDSAFRWACWRGQLAVAKWLVGLGGRDIHAMHDDAFRGACEWWGGDTGTRPGGW